MFQVCLACSLYYISYFKLTTFDRVRYVLYIKSCCFSHPFYHWQSWGLCYMLPNSPCNITYSASFVRSTLIKRVWKLSRVSKYKKDITWTGFCFVKYFAVCFVVPGDHWTCLFCPSVRPVIQSTSISIVYPKAEFLNQWDLTVSLLGREISEIIINSAIQNLPTQKVSAA
jgi:hypothetical protein